MKSIKLNEIIKQGNVVVPLYLIQNIKNLNIDMKELVFIMYLSNFGVKSLFDPHKASENFNVELMEIMTLVSSLSEKKLLTVDVEKNDKNIREEFINLENFYNKLSNLVITNINEEPKNNINVYESIEKEFGRTLSPIEYEIIKAWIDSDTSLELILEALKEATMSGVSNLRYIDKILYEWGKKGFKTKLDVFNHKNKVKHEKKNDVEVVEYAWYEDDE